jgi:hypothetical protein
MRIRLSPIQISRVIPFLAVIIAISAGAPGSTARSSEATGSVAPDAASSGVEEQINTLIHRWFDVLEDPTVEVVALNALLAEAPFDLALDGEVLRDRDALLAWITKFRESYSQVEFRIDPIRVEPNGQDLYRARFEFDRRAMDGEGFSHVARREHTWIVRSRSDAETVVLTIKERPLLYFPGTGPQIICY